MEVYMDDMLVKNKVARTHIDDLQETFAILQKYQMKLNPIKCAFGVALDKFHGFIISNWGVETNLEKIKAICNMSLPRTIKDVQGLTKRIAALN